MAEILGIGCSHAPMILNPPEEWPRTRERIMSRVPPRSQISFKVFAVWE
jgi:hypothetical protein